MTLQVGLVGTDGIVLASDMLWNANNGRVWYTQSRSKIIVNHDRKIAVSFARSMEAAEKAANAIVSEAITDEQWESPKERIEEVVRKAIQSVPFERDEANCIVVSAKPELSLFQVEMGVDMGQGPERRPLCWQYWDKAFAGDNLNSAVYLAERYYQKLPVRKLLPIAAQTILAGGKLSPERIRGLEIVVCRESGFKKLSQDEINSLVEWSESVDALMDVAFARCPDVSI